MILFKNYTPVTISKLVKSIWYMELTIDDPVYEEEIIPDGHHELIFYLTASCSQRQVDTNTWLEEPYALLAGQTTECYRLKMFAGAKLYGIRFFPHTLYHLLNFPLHSLNAAVLPLDELLPGHGFWNHITDNPEQTFQNIENYLADLLKATSNPYIEYSLGQILNSNGTIAVGDLIKKSGVTPKHYDDLFKKYVGITPKYLCAILKFNFFISYKKSYPEKTLTECAYEAGYYDQSHLIKSFYQFARMSPGKYFGSNPIIGQQFAGL